MDKNTVREMIQIMRTEISNQMISAVKEYGVDATIEVSETYNDFFNTLTDLNEARA